MKFLSIFTRNEPENNEIDGKKSDGLTNKAAAVQVNQKKVKLRYLQKLFLGHDFVSRQFVCDNDWHRTRVSCNHDSTFATRRC